MIKKTSNKADKLIISHIADIDGMGSVCLAKNKWSNVDYILVEFSETKSILEELLITGDYKKYSEIFITDLSLRDEEIKIINSCKELVGKIRHFDHHYSEMKNNIYPFVNVVYEQHGKLVSGTDLFYSYLQKNGIRRTAYIESFVEAIRSYDTWDWVKDKNQIGKDLTDLFSIIGPELFIERFTKKIHDSNSDIISKKEQSLIEYQQQTIKEYIRKCDENLIMINIDGYNVGISISELFRSDVGNALSKKYEDKLDYILIINLMKNQYSFRTVKDNINVGEIAKTFSQEAGGQPKAAGAPITKENSWILSLTIEEMQKKEAKKTLTKTLL